MRDAPTAVEFLEMQQTTSFKCSFSFFPYCINTLLKYCQHTPFISYLGPDRRTDEEVEFHPGDMYVFLLPQFPGELA
jgi:hypothetical protein